MGFFDSIIGAGANLIGGLIGKKGAENAANTQMQIAQQNIALQREFAQNGVRWKVDDARAAGISPLYALGAPTMSFSPVSVGSINTEAPLADAAARSGQDLSRAVQATRTQTERTTAVNDTANVLTLQNMELRNELLKAQISKLTGPAVPPPFPGPGNYIPGQGDTPELPTVVPSKVNPPVSDPFIAGGFRFEHAPGWVKGEVVENEYSDALKEPYGIVRLGRDYIYNADRFAQYLWDQGKYLNRKYRLHDLNPFAVRPAY